MLFMERQREGASVRSPEQCVRGARGSRALCSCVWEEAFLPFVSTTSNIAPCLMHWVNFSSITNDDKLTILWLKYCVLSDTVLILKLCNMKILFPNLWKVVFNTLLLPNSPCLGRDVITQAFYNFIEHTIMKDRKIM